MAGLFCNSRVTSLLVNLLVLVTVQRINGYPYQWPELLSSFPFRNVKPATSWKEITNQRDLVTSITSKDYGRETAASGETIHYSETLMSYNGGNGESRLVDGSSKKRPSERDIDEDNAEKNDDISDAEKNDADDEIGRLIEQAFHDDVFLTPEKWSETLADKTIHIPVDEGMSVKIQKPRSPSDPPNTVTATGQTGTNDRIVFPDDVSNKPVPSCKGTTFCVNAPYYPSDIDVEKALTPRTRDLIGEQIITPKTGMDENNEWRYIVNNEQYVQTVRVEICEARNEACRIIDAFASGYTTSCKQKYIYRQLVAMGANNTSSEVPFQIPSSCCCHVKFTGDTMARIGFRLDENDEQRSVPNGTEN